MHAHCMPHKAPSCLEADQQSTRKLSTPQYHKLRHTVGAYAANSTAYLASAAAFTPGRPAAAPAGRPAAVARGLRQAQLLGQLVRQRRACAAAAAPPASRPAAHVRKCLHLHGSGPQHCRLVQN